MNGLAESDSSGLRSEEEKDSCHTVGEKPFPNSGVGIQPESRGIALVTPTFCHLEISICRLFLGAGMWKEQINPLKEQINRSPKVSTRFRQRLAACSGNVEGYNHFSSR